MRKLKKWMHRNTDPIGIITKAFHNQITALSAHIEAKQIEVDRHAITIATAQDAIDVAVTEIVRAQVVRDNITKIVGEVE